MPTLDPTRSDSYRYVRIITNLATIELMTPEQRSAIAQLAQKPTAQEIMVRQDTLFNGGLLFQLYGNRGADDCFLNGLIEPDGSVNT